MSQRRDFTRGDAELYVDSGLYDKQSNQPRAFGMPGAITQSLADFGLFLVMAQSEIFQANRGKNCKKSFRPAPIEAKEAARRHDHHESN